MGQTQCLCMNKLRFADSFAAVDFIDIPEISQMIVSYIKENRRKVTSAACKHTGRMLASVLVELRAPYG